ncbi:MAG: serine hydrolase domain-containing protein [Gemmatimonadota bacterium]
MINRSHLTRTAASLAGAVTALLALSGHSAAQGGRNGTATPAAAAPTLKAGFSRDRLARMDAFLQSYVDSNRVGGAVALVLRDGQVAYERAVGWSDVEGRRRMTMDAMFRIASQSKALTSVAIMILIEEGKIGLSNPVSQFMPPFARTTVISRPDSGRTLIPASRQITIRDLLTHTAGISYGTDALLGPLYSAKALGPAAGYGWYLADKEELVCESMERLATLPFSRQPGEAFVYGYNTDILGCVVERVSGMPLDKFMETRITQPLGMNDTYFFVPESKRQRLVTLTMSDSTNHAMRAPEGARGQGHYLDGPRRNFAGGAGIVSTARDYARLLEMLRNGGELDGVRIMSRKTAELMTTNQVGTLYSANGQGFGLGFSIVERVGADNTSHSVGTWGWGGAYGSQYRVDPVERITWVFMVNQLPNRADMVAKFPVLLYSALVK